MEDTQNINKNIVKASEVDTPKKYTTKSNILGARIHKLAHIVKHFNAKVCPIITKDGTLYLNYFEILCTENIGTELVNELHKNGYSIQELRLSKLSNKLMLLVVKLNTDEIDIKTSALSFFGDIFTFTDEDIDV